MGGSSSTADFVKQYGQLQRCLEEAQRDAATFAISKRVYLAIDDDATAPSAACEPGSGYATKTLTWRHVWPFGE
jgi:hypothetical protein